MTSKLILISLADLIIDPKDAARLVDAACARKPKMKAVGLFQLDDKFVVALEEGEPPHNHVFAPLPDDSEDALLAELTARHHSGFTFLGGLRLNGRPWALFAKHPFSTKPAKALEVFKKI